MAGRIHKKKTAASEPEAGPGIRRPTIAFLTRAFSIDLISYSIWSGIYDAARAAEVNLVCLPGNPPRSSLGFEYQANVLFDMVEKQSMDGLLIWGGAMVGVSSVADTQAFYRRFADFPVINISLMLEGIPGIAIDNYGGMYEACAHLITRHQCRRIAFIRGPENHPEAQLRFRAYTEALFKFQLPFDPDLMVSGNFLREAGQEGVKTLLEVRRLRMDALVAANDLMALGAAEELARRGVFVPEEVKLVGFDDIEESRAAPIALTTVKQPFYEMGKAAVGNLLDLIQGKQVNEKTILPSRLIERQSCGCLHASALQNSVKPEMDAAETTGPDRTGFRAAVIAQLAEGQTPSAEPEQGVTAGWERLAECLYDELCENKNGVFLEAFNRQLLHTAEMKTIRQYHFHLSALRRALVPYLRRDADLIIRAETLLHRARIIIGEYLERHWLARDFQETTRSEVLSSINRKLISASDFGDFIGIIEREFPQFGLRSYYFCAYEEPTVSLLSSRLLLAFADRQRIRLPEGGLLFPTRKILPEGMLPEGRPLTIIVEALYFRGEQLGYMVFEDDHKAGALYEELRSHLSVALKGTFLLQEKERLLDERERQAREIIKTSEGLARSNADLAQFSYVVSHDLQEPLRKIAVFADRLKDECGKSLSDQAGDYLDRIRQSAERMHRLIQDLLHYAQLSKSTEPFRTVNLNESIRAVLQDLEVRIEQEKARVEVGHLPTLEAEPRRLEQVFQNLISNALKFHLPGQPVEIKISSRWKTVANREYCEIIVADNGIGIDDHHLSEIFGVFQRLHGKMEYEGTGIGLAICKKVVEAHHGDIRVESALGKGARFIVTLPVRQADADKA